MVKKTEDNETPSDERESLVGSGTPMVSVRAHVRVLGLQPSETRELPDTPELRENARVGNVTILSGE